jgi:hypothetical protein
MSPIGAKGTGKEKHSYKKEMDMCVVMLINIVVQCFESHKFFCCGISCLRMVGGGFETLQ